MSSYNFTRTDRIDEFVEFGEVEEVGPEVERPLRRRLVLLTGEGSCLRLIDFLSLNSRLASNRGEERVLRTSHLISEQRT